jgi:hypothetical protein
MHSIKKSNKHSRISSFLNLLRFLAGNSKKIIRKIIHILKSHTELELLGKLFGSKAYASAWVQKKNLPNELVGSLVLFAKMILIIIYFRKFISKKIK